MQQALGRATRQGCPNPACITSLPCPVHAPAKGAPSCLPRCITSDRPSVPTTPAPQSPWPPAQGSWAGPSISACSPRRAGGAACRGHGAQGGHCAADGTAAVCPVTAAACPVEARASGCGPGPGSLAQAGRAGVSASPVGALLAAQCPALPTPRGGPAEGREAAGLGSPVAVAAPLLPSPAPGLGFALFQVNTCFPGAIGHTGGEEEASRPYFQAGGGSCWCPSYRFPGCSEDRGAGVILCCSFSPHPTIHPTFGRWGFRVPHSCGGFQGQPDPTGLSLRG